VTIKSPDPIWFYDFSQIGRENRFALFPDLL
jgi:hypothetical protein